MATVKPQYWGFTALWNTLFLKRECCSWGAFWSNLSKWNASLKFCTCLYTWPRRALSCFYRKPTTWPNYCVWIGSVFPCGYLLCPAPFFYVHRVHEWMVNFLHFHFSVGKRECSNWDNCSYLNVGSPLASKPNSLVRKVNQTLLSVNH